MSSPPQRCCAARSTGGQHRAPPDHSWRVSCGAYPVARQRLRHLSYNRPMKPSYWQQASSDLAQGDPVLGPLVDRFAGTALVSRGEPFVTLVRSIVGQQISVKAADSVWARLLAALPALAPRAVLGCGAEVLRGCGLSARKVEYVIDLARRFDNGQIHAERWSEMDDAEIVAELTAVRGIGVWTAEMFLIFNQLRPDVFPPTTRPGWSGRTRPPRANAAAAVTCAARWCSPARSCRSARSRGGMR